MGETNTPAEEIVKRIKTNENEIAEVKKRQDKLEQEFKDNYEALRNDVDTLAYDFEKMVKKVDAMALALVGEDGKGGMAGDVAWTKKHLMDNANKSGMIQGIFLTLGAMGVIVTILYTLGIFHGAN